MKKFIEYIPLAISFAVILTIATIVFIECLSTTNGKFIYILDDTYIHLAYAKNIVTNNIAGISQYENSSSSSSPLWTLILVSIFYLSGVNEYIPLVLNIILSSILIIILFFIFRRYSLSDFFNTISLLAVIIITPLAINIFSGMEHLLQTILVILFIFLSVKELTKEKIPPGKIDKITNFDLYIFILSALLISVRYEDLIVILVISGLFFFQKKYLKAVVIILCAIFPLFFFGLISIYNGGYIIPNSVLVKFTLPESVRIFTAEDMNERLINYININKKIIFLFILSLTLFILQIRLKKNFLTEIPLLLFIIISIILLHKISLPSSLFRYDAYLVISSIVINAIAINNFLSEKHEIKIDFTYIKKSKIAFSFLILFSIYLIYKCSDSRKAIIASKNIYEQQYQMSQFINKYYQGKEVALNDIGAVNFFADIRCTDFIGIGSTEVVREKLKRSFNTRGMKEIAERNNVKIAVLYEKWFEGIGGIPSGWSKTGEWKIQDNFICADDVVSFYAVTPDEKKKLENNLKSFSGELPASVIQSGDYLKK